MKILFFIDSLHAGGKERRLVELIKGLSKSPEIEIELVLVKKEIHYKCINTTNIKIHYTIRKDIKKDPRVFNSFYKIAKIFKPDIIHVWSNLVAIYAIPTKVLLKIPMINNQITNSTLQNSSKVLSHKLTFPFSDRIIANTFAGLKAYNAPMEKSKVIYNGLDFNRIANLQEKNRIREKFEIRTKYVVAMVASFTEKKDYHTYIKAANKILEHRNDITFLCVGSGKSDKFKKMVMNNNSILFLGKQDHVESIMNICDIGVLMTDTKHREGISNAIMEFNALGKPVIATLDGGTGEIIENDVSGYLIKPKSSSELVEKILYLINNKKERLAFGRNANNIVINKFGIERMIEEFKTSYKELLSKN